MESVTAELQTKAHEHVVQFYGRDEGRRVHEAAEYLAVALGAGGAALVVASDPRRNAILAELRARLGTDLVSDGRLLLLDAEEILATFMRDGRPDPALFDRNVGERVTALALRHGQLRAYGEMVGCLWEKRAFAAAIELERLWNRLMERVDFDLFCGYPIDVLSDDFQSPAVHAVLTAHSRLAPSLSPAFEAAMRRAMDEVLPHALPVSVFGAERTILGLRSVFPRHAEDVIARARDYASGSCKSAADRQHGVDVRSEAGKGLYPKRRSEPIDNP